MVIHAMTVGGGGGAVLPSLADLPAVDTDAAALLEAAELLHSAGSKLRNRSEDTVDAWDGLSAVYTASGTELLYSQLQPLRSRGDSMGTALSTAGDALWDFALAVGGLKFDREALASRITSLRTRYYETEADSTERFMLQSEIMNLQIDVSSFAGRVEMAEQTCSDTLAGIRGGTATGVTHTAGAASRGYVAALDAAVSVSVMDQLDQLAGMTPEDAAAWLAAHPEFAEALQTSPPPVADVVAWWATIAENDAMVDALINGMPSGIGNLNGVPYTVRSEANVIALDAELLALAEQVAGMPTWESTLTGDPIYNFERAALKDKLDGLLAVAISMGADWAEEGMSPHDILAAVQGGHSGYATGSYQLVELHLGGELPFAAVASGNLDTADYVTVLAPGMDSTVEDTLAGLVANGDSLTAAQQAELAARGESGEVAVLSWMGYETPGKLSVFGNDHAINGAPAFGDTLAGLNGTLVNDPYTSVVMHSYGGTMGSWALSQGDYDVDNAVFLNSPGVIIDSASDMHVDNTWAATPPDDYVVDVGNQQNEHPHLPRREEFGGFWYAVPDTPGGIIGAHGLDHHFLDSNGDPYGPGSEAPGGALAPLVDITLGNGEDSGSVVAEDPDQWWQDHLAAPETQPPW